MRFLAAGVGVGMGRVFAGYLNGLSRNPGLESKLFTYVLLGFANRSQSHYSSV